MEEDREAGGYLRWNEIFASAARLCEYFGGKGWCNHYAHAYKDCVGVKNCELIDFEEEI